MKELLLPPKAETPTNKTWKNEDHITCYKCDETGYYTNECTKDTKQGKQFLNNLENENHEDVDYDDDDECSDCTFTNILCKQSMNVDLTTGFFSTTNPLLMFSRTEGYSKNWRLGKTMTINAIAGIACKSLVGDLHGYG